MTQARRALDQALSEADWQRTVTDLAHTLGWLTYHVHDSRRSVFGFPDLVMVRDRVIFAELKSQRGQLTDDQWSWLATLRDAGAEMYVWRPSDYPNVELILSARHDLTPPPEQRTIAIDTKGRL